VPLEGHGGTRCRGPASTRTSLRSCFSQLAGDPVDEAGRGLTADEQDIGPSPKYGFVLWNPVVTREDGGHRSEFDRASADHDVYATIAHRGATLGPSTDHDVDAAAGRASMSLPRTNGSRWATKGDATQRRTVLSLSRADERTSDGLSP
jgi:hypothetical protein